MRNLLDIQILNIPKLLLDTLIYAHWISRLLLNEQILDIKTFIGYTNIGYQNIDCI